MKEIAVHFTRSKTKGSGSHRILITTDGELDAYSIGVDFEVSMAFII